MEQLALLVLNGDGRRLIEHTSEQPEIQAFLANVPAYMVSHIIVRTIITLLTFISLLE